MITADQLLAHAVGDYVLQSDWMANEKTKKSVAALCHVLTYALPFLFLRSSWPALAVIVSTHFIIDRWRLARYVVWAKNWLGFRPEHQRCAALADDGSACPYPPVRYEWHCYAHRCDPPSRSPINPSFDTCKATGYPPDRPAWLAVWLLIIADNIMHVLINGLALKYL
jgi:hypothetical protein